MSNCTIHNKSSATILLQSFLCCRGEKTRTSDLHVPNVARCQLCYTPSVHTWKSGLPYGHAFLPVGGCKGTHFLPNKQDLEQLISCVCSEKASARNSRQWRCVLSARKRCNIRAHGASLQEDMFSRMLTICWKHMYEAAIPAIFPGVTHVSMA